MVMDGQCHALPFYPQERELVTIVQEAGCSESKYWGGGRLRWSTTPFAFGGEEISLHDFPDF